jgi:DHA1 family bicyclomycin/chloramphenicol resistance-like MFS transporter
MTERPAAPRGIAMLLAAMSALAPFSIDTYLPAFHEIGEKLQATPLQVQQTLSIYLLSFAVMTLWHGAIADRFGRRRVILTALGLFALASLGCMLATSIGQLWFWRAMQGITAGAGIVISRAIVRDLYDGPAAQRLMSQISMMFALAPAIAPVIGGWLEVAFGWRAIFVFLVLLAGSLWFACWRWLPETLPAEKRQTLNPHYLASTYLRVLTSSRFLLACGAITCNFSGFFVYVLSAPVFLIEHLGLPETAFLWLFGPAMAGLLVGSWLSGRLAGKRSRPTTIGLGYALMASAALLNLAINVTLPPGLPWSIAPMFIYTTGMSLVMPIMTLYALDPFPEQRGLAASCQTFLQAGSNGLVAGMIAPAVWGTTLSLAISMAVFLTLGALFTWRQQRSALLPG